MQLPPPSPFDPSLKHALCKNPDDHDSPLALPPISEATIDDALKILALQRHAYLCGAELSHDFQIPPLTETLEDIHREFERQVFFKAVVDSRIIASARAMPEDGTCYISRVIVHPDLQNRGLGAQLMNRVEARFPDAARFELFTSEKNERNLRFYTKLGYREFKRVPRETDQTELVYMEKCRNVHE
ncbi:MAG: GNAT family N-acetyltransferase [Planctomycetia bacterium]|jgi:ribosomal protein S18 acetylase RimI-like enzyme